MIDRPLTGLAVNHLVQDDMPRGHVIYIHLTLLPELKPLSSSAAHLTRVEQMIDQYTAFVEDSWRKLPESVSWGALRRYANQPVSLERTSPAL